MLTSPVFDLLSGTTSGWSPPRSFGDMSCTEEGARTEHVQVTLTVFRRQIDMHNTLSPMPAHRVSSCLQRAEQERKLRKWEDTPSRIAHIIESPARALSSHLRRWVGACDVLDVRPMIFTSRAGCTIRDARSSNEHVFDMRAWSQALATHLLPSQEHSRTGHALRELCTRRGEASQQRSLAAEGQTSLRSASGWAASGAGVFVT